MRLYVETSVISFWFDTQLRNRAKKRAARRFLLLCANKTHESYVSLIVRDELNASREPYRSRDLGLVTRLGLKDASFDAPLYARLVEAYRREPLLTRLPDGDHRHLALFTACDLEALVTCNLKDLANQYILDAVRKVNHAEGIDKEIRSGPPEAFIPPQTPE